MWDTPSTIFQALLYRFSGPGMSSTSCPAVAFCITYIDVEFGINMRALRGWHSTEVAITLLTQ